MARFFFFIVIVGGTTLGMFATKPTPVDYLEKLESRAAVIASMEHDAYTELRGGDLLDQMVAVQSPTRLLEQTRIDDYVVFNVFTTEFEAPGYNTRRVRTYGVFSTLIPTKD